MHRNAIAFFIAVGWLCISGVVRSDESLYKSKIKTVLQARCYACHGALKQNGGLRLDTAEYAIAGGESGAAIVRHDAHASPLLERVASTDLATRMPPEGEALKPEEIETIRRWIELGATAPADEKPELDPQEHWAFRPPQKRPLPSETHADWAGNPIDHWVGKQLHDYGLTPQPPAPKSIWLRRVYLDLIGLPPSLEELDAFEQDSSAEAVDKVVTRLLDSPQYGERWGRHWMDIWRYSDAWGLGDEIRNSQRHLWRWRDWIVESLNDDKPYPQMLCEMLAADELYPNDPTKLRATGYLARHYFKFNRTTWMDETVEHTAKAMLGLTMNCAKCHDHKYDPLTQREYYQMRAFFEPYQVRMDMVRGELNFDKDALTRVFDCNLDVPTFLHIRGDDRNLDRNQTLDAKLPRFLCPEGIEIQSVALPSASYMPSVQLDVIQTYRAQALAEISQAELGLRDFQNQPQESDATSIALATLELRRSELESLDARWQADCACADAPTPLPEDHPVQSVIGKAARAQRQAELQGAKLKLLQANLALKNASAEKQGDAQKNVEQANKELETATAALDSSNLAYRSLKGSLKTLESNLEDENSRSKAFPRTSTGRRAALAKWIASEQNPLTARVAVNHIWSRHFGQPLVSTVFDFGRKGKAPTHPELLDWLAVDFIEHEGSMKHIHRMIVTSQAYRMSSSSLGAPERNLQFDPENLYLWRMPSKRLESQLVRDSMLKLASKLDSTMGGPSIAANEESSTRRSIYYFQSHNDHNEFLSMFDDANVMDCYRRTESIVPQQSLALANSKLVHDLAGPIAEHIESSAKSSEDVSFVQTAYRLLLASNPTPQESQLLASALQKFRESARLRLENNADAAERFAKREIVRVLLNHNDFITVR